MKINNAKRLSKPARLIFFYGLYSVLCHIFISAVYCDYISGIQPIIFESLFFNLFEYSVISLVIVIAGGLLADISTKQKSVN